MSSPLVPFRETIAPNRALVDPLLQQKLFNFSLIVQGQNESLVQESIPSLGQVTCLTPNKLCKLGLRSVPMPPLLIDFVLKNTERLQKSVNNAKKQSLSSSLSEILINELFKVTESKEFKNKESPKEDWTRILQDLCSLGPKQSGSNVLVCPRELSVSSQFESSLITGFQIATASGPLCAEPMHGVCFILESFAVEDEDDIVKMSFLSGQIISTMRDLCRLAFLQWSPRLMLAMYSCDLQTPSDVLGKVYAVLSKRKGRILSEEMREGTNFFLIKSLLPVIESFGFSDGFCSLTNSN